MSNYLPVSQQLKILFEVVTHPDGRPYTIKEVSQQINISPATISQMRSGKIKDPQLNTLRELCRFFNVPLRYFETATAEECYTVLVDRVGEITPAINEIALRSLNLSPESQRDILTVIQWVQAAEQQRKAGKNLPPVPGLESYDDHTNGDEDQGG